MQSAATQWLLQLTEYLLSIFSWSLEFSKLSLAWEAITVMIKKKITFSFGCCFYIVDLDLTLLAPLMVCYTVLIRVFIQVEFLVLHFLLGTLKLYEHWRSIGPT